jgi:cellulase
MASLFTARTILVLGLVALFFQSAVAHTYLSSIFLNNQALADGDCVRPHPATAYDSPIPLVTSPDMTCGWLPSAATPANRKCPVAAGSTIGLQWHHQSSSPSDDIIDPTHVGPIIVYLAKSDTGAGNVWFKIYEDGFANGQWAVNRLIANKGRVDITIPSDIAPGNYLLRGELIALHGAYAVNGVQPYVGCVELTISGSGAANPAGVAFPGYYTNQDPGMLFSVYQPFTKYIIPGPALYKSGSSSSSGTPTTKPTTTPSTAPTTRPTTAPTTKPTSAPATSAPTTKPTSAPATSAPTSKPTSGGNVKVNIYPSSTAWWFAISLTGNTGAISKVELKDSKIVTAFTPMTANAWGALTVYTYSPQGTALLAPLTVQITSSSGKVVQATITSLTTGVFEANGSL